MNDSSKRLSVAEQIRKGLEEAKARRIGPTLRRAGLEFDSRNRRVVRRGRAEVRFGCEYLGADDQAGPNFTGQAAVDSYYRWC